jgi:hypothetical protein
MKYAPFTIRVKSREEYRQAITLLMAFGINHFDDKTDADEIARESFPEYSGIMVRKNDTFCGICSYSVEGELHFDAQLQDIMDILTGKSIEIKVDGIGDYTAIISSKNVKVGCQIISHEKVLEIANAIKTVMS